METHDLLTTTEAARLTGRSLDTVRSAVKRGQLAATSVEGRWWIERELVLAWHNTSNHIRIKRRPVWDDCADVIAEYGSVSAAELAQLAGIHVGNARKHLAILAKQGRARRLEDGQWVLSADQEQGAA